PQAIRRLGDRPQDRPDKRALALLVGPGVEVVGDEREREPALLGKPRVADEIGRPELLARERIADLRSLRHVSACGLSPCRPCVRPPSSAQSSRLATSSLLIQISSRLGARRRAGSRSGPPAPWTFPCPSRP